jgi:glycerate-2-kinase
LLDNRRAMAEARRLAEARGYECEVAADLVEGAVEEMAREHLRRLEHLRRTAARVCLISGGEAICPVRGSGEGGRNQEFVLRAALNLSGDLAGRTDHSILMLSAGTDGIDGRSPAAGAIADRSTIERARALGLDPADFLARSDSYNFFRRLGDLIVTGPTGNNVRDLRLLMAN